jgi:hydrogenase maturation protein HypF
MKEDVVAKRLNVNGIVQGVGFRPFVYQLAKRLGLTGDIANTASGVSVHLEGASEDIEIFSKALVEDCPPLAQITEISVVGEPLKNFAEFIISPSRGEHPASTLISPDVSICADCLRELFDPKDRRYHYPFINCTHCGPRYTIITSIPYDRENTSMRHFKMCKDCQAEYDDPANRRFHAQPNACAVCGPEVTLYDNKGGRVRTQDPIAQTAQLLKMGRLVAVKGLGGFHIAADAENSDAVIRLRQRKGREEKPLAVMSMDLEQIRLYAHVSSEDEALLTSFQRPIVLLRKRISHTLSEAVSPKNNYIGVMLPYTPVHCLILSYGFMALVMTSGNLSEEPIAIDNSDAFTRLGHIVDYLLVHNRDIYLRSDDSVARSTAGATRLIRRSRGFAPAPVFLKSTGPDLLACGAELKNTVCLTKGNKAFLSQHIGDMENLASYDFFKMTIEHMKQILDIHPQIIVHDLHPDYLSTRYALEQEDPIQRIGVQHHHAHIASCMAEHQIDGTVVGLSFDGTGYGGDGTIWGGEILIADLKAFTRAASFHTVKMPGSAAAIREPWRMAVSYLYDAFGEGIRDLDLPFLEELDKRRVEIVIEMISKNINAPMTSSLGRFFDAIAAMIGIRSHAHYEGQAAMELEMAIGEETEEVYECEWTKGDQYMIMPQPIVRSVVQDLRRGASPAVISARFHSTLIRLFSQLCGEIRKDTGLNRAVLSGGVFQNAILLTGLIRALENKGFEVFSHSRVPTNDGGISLGQAVIAAHQDQSECRRSLWKTDP